MKALLYVVLVAIVIVGYAVTIVVLDGRFQEVDMLVGAISVILIAVALLSYWYLRDMRPSRENVPPPRRNNGSHARVASKIKARKKK